MKKNINFNCFFCVIVCVIVLYSGCSLIANFHKLQNLNTAYQQQEIAYQEEMNRCEELSSYTESEIQEMAIDKARENGYSFPNEKVFYNID